MDVVILIFVINKLFVFKIDFVRYMPIFLRWEDKENKLFWKGRDSRRERLNLVKLSQKEGKLNFQNFAY